MEVHVPQSVIINHILTRLPAKSLGRFRCVSKKWLWFLSTDTFRNNKDILDNHVHDILDNHLHVDNDQNNNKLLVFSKTETSFDFSTINCEAPPSDKNLTPTRRPLPPFDGITPYDIHILTSCHGLVCLGIIKDMCHLGYSDLILWNPLTNEYKRLAKSTSLTNEYIWFFGSNFGLYYSCCEDEYKLLYVNVFDDYVYVYLLKSDSWRKVDAFQQTSIFYDVWSRGTCSNGNLYFLQQNSDGRLSSVIVIRFDTKAEKFSKIETQNVDANPNGYLTNDYATIMIKSDCIHVCVKYDIIIRCDTGFERTTCIKLWKLDENENMEEVVTYQLRPHVDGFSMSYLVPFHLMTNGHWLMRNCSSQEHKIYLVHLKKNERYFKEKDIIYDDFEYAEVSG